MEFQRRYFMWFAIFIGICQLVDAQKNYQLRTIAFYNVENLFDTVLSAGIIDGSKDYWDPEYHVSVDENGARTIQTPKANFRLTYENLAGKEVKRNLILNEEFTPQGKANWDTPKYLQKLSQIAAVISEIGRENTNQAPVIVGLAELENEHVLKDLVAQRSFQSYGYERVHFNSFDARGIDVGMIYQKKRFVVEQAKPYVVEIFDEQGKREYTRDILRVSGYLDGEPLHVLVNHWPSKRGGEKASAHKRIKAAEVCRAIIEEIKQKEPQAKIIVMGDFNDGPTSKGIKLLETTAKKKETITKNVFYNPMEEISRRGGGTAAYQDRWETLDQIMLSASILNGDHQSFKLYKSGIFKPNYLVQATGQFKGYPYRTYSFGKYQGGYSDHFPVYVQLIKEK